MPDASPGGPDLLHNPHGVRNTSDQKGQFHQGTWVSSHKARCPWEAMRLVGRKGKPVTERSRIIWKALRQPEKRWES